MPTKEYHDFIETLKVGDIVTFRKKNSPFKIKAEIRSLYFNGKKLFLNLYDLFSRREKVYFLNNRFELESPFSKKKKKHDIVLTSSYEFNEHDEKKENKFLNIINKTVIVIVLIAFVFSINPVIKLSTARASYSYSDFLKKDFTLGTLYTVVTKRVKYSYDLNENWQSPETAWKNRTGDCEEYASIISDYLNHHNIENYLIGLNSKNSGTGHAVVFAKENNYFYIIDPTRAKEISGIKKLKSSESLRDAVLKYSDLPVSIYQIPHIDGEKKVIDVIYE